MYTNKSVIAKKNNFIIGKALLSASCESSETMTKRITPLFHDQKMELLVGRQEKMQMWGKEPVQDAGLEQRVKENTMTIVSLQLKSTSKLKLLAEIKYQ